LIIRIPTIAATATLAAIPEAEQRPCVPRLPTSLRPCRRQRRFAGERDGDPAAQNRGIGAEQLVAQRRSDQRVAQSLTMCFGIALEAPQQESAFLIGQLIVDECRNLIVDLFCHWAAALSVLMSGSKQRGDFPVDSLACAKNSRTHRADGALHGLRDFFVAKALDFAQQNGRSELLGQVSDGSVHGLSDLFRSARGPRECRGRAGPVSDSVCSGSCVSRL
jgi:hypothetical protein